MNNIVVKTLLCVSLLAASVLALPTGGRAEEQSQGILVAFI